MTKNLLPLTAALLVFGAAQSTQAQVISGGGADWTFVGGSLLEDAETLTQFDAFDDALRIYVNGTQALTGFGGTDNATFTLGSAVNVAGLSVTSRFDALQTSPTLRSFFTFTNTTNSLFTGSLGVQTNVGSDTGTIIKGTSSGDLLFGTNDRWIVTDDNALGGDPENLHVLWFTGGQAPASVTNSVFSSFGTEGVGANWNVSLAAGQTISLLFFNQITDGDIPTNVVGSNTALFNSLSSGLTFGLSQAELARTINIGQVTVVAVPEPSTYGLVGAAALTGLVLLRRRRATAK